MVVGGCRSFLLLVTTKYENKWAVSIFAEWQRLREVQVPVLDCGGLFKDYDLQRLPL